MDTNHKINIEELIKSFKVTNEDSFSSYLKDVWIVCFVHIIIRILLKETKSSIKESIN